MYATDFIYDDIPLSNWGMTICSFNGGTSLETFSLGSEISFNVASVPGKSRRNFYSSNYENILTATFQICKCTSNKIATPISTAELSKIMRWLNRNDSYHKFKLIQDGFENLYAEANFNVSKIEIAGIVYGLELTLTTLHPYLLEEKTEINIDLLDNNSFVIYDTSDEIGHIYPNMEVTCNADGNLIITNEFEHRATQINHCQAGEKISIDGETLIIKTDSDTHQIQADFNYTFFRLVNTFKNNKNVISVSLPCSLSLKWNPIRKIGF